MRILAAAGDLFFRVKLEAMARRAGAEFRVVKSEAELAEARGVHFDAVVVDLESRAFDPLKMIAEVQSGWPAADVWGFAAHEHGELMESARRAGCRVVLARGAFEVRFPRYLAGAE